MSDKKKGRPTSNPKTYQMRIRFSKDDKEKLEYCSYKTGKTKSDIIREGIELVATQIKEKK